MHHRYAKQKKETFKYSRYLFNTFYLYIFQTVKNILNFSKKIQMYNEIKIFHVFMKHKTGIYPFIPTIKWIFLIYLK